MAGFLNRENNVPKYQRLFQQNDGLRIWMKTPRGRALFYPYCIMLGGAFTASMYGMVRMCFGKKTWY